MVYMMNILLLYGNRWPGGTYSSLTPAARVQLPDAALLRLTQATIRSGSVKCVATIEQLATAVEDGGRRM